MLCDVLTTFGIDFYFRLHFSPTVTLSVSTRRPMLPFFTLLAGSFIFFILGGWLLRLLGVKDPTTRYFLLHVLCNGFVTVVHMDDVIISYLDPLTAMKSLPTDTQGAAVIAAVHFYHILFYQPLPIVDWVHHAVMILLMLPLAVALNAGALLGHGAWFSSGFPGGLDYLMLVLVKYSFMDSLREKQMNSFIQTWIRAPGCIYHSLWTWIGWRIHYDYVVANSYLPSWAVSPALFVVMITFFWNGMYFQTRVVANYAIKCTIQREKKEESNE